MEIKLKSNLPIWIFILTLGLSVLFQSGELKEKLRLNATAVSALAVSQDFEALQLFNPEESRTGTFRNCHLPWYLGFIQEYSGSRELRDRYWAEAVQCEPELVRYLYNRYPDDLQLAITIHQAQPESGSSWFWLGDLQPENRLVYYQKGLSLEPQDGRRWNELGGMLAKNGDLEPAMQAYLQTCLNGDPGYNGCWRAGQMAEKLGDIPSAISYYRLSRWKQAFDRAQELEAQFPNIELP
jgi:hypothetical protein